MNNNIVLDEFKHFDKTRKKEDEPQKPEQEQKIITLPSFVSTCLTPIHSECTGQYTDTFNLFRLNCHCMCHINQSRSELPKEAGN